MKSKTVHARLASAWIASKRSAVPRLIADCGCDAAESFLTHLNSKVADFRERAATIAAIAEFCEWTDQRNRTVHELSPMTTSIYLELLRHRTSPANSKRHWLALCLLFDWFVAVGILKVNSAVQVPNPELGLSWPKPTADQPAHDGAIDVVVSVAA